MRIRSLILAAAVLAAGLGQPAQAATLAILSGFGDKIFLVNSGSAKLIDTLDLDSSTGSVNLTAIAVLLRDGSLIGVKSDRTIVRIDVKTGFVTRIATLGVAGLPPSSMSCDPVEGDCRLVSFFDPSQVTFNPSTGQAIIQKNLKYKRGSAKPRVAAIAYSNATASATKTTLYDIDVETKALHVQNGDGGVLKSVGKLAVAVNSLQLGFAVAYNARKKTNTGYLAFKRKLHVVDLAKGKAKAGKAVAGLPNEIRAMVVLN